MGSFKDNNIQLKTLYQCTQQEIMRRILIILDSFFAKNTSWINVLPIQINALKEIKSIYKYIKN